MSAYVYPNYKSKKAVKEVIKAGEKVTCSENTPQGKVTLFNGTACVEGPHYPEPHRWYGQVEVKDGFVINIK